MICFGQPVSVSILGGQCFHFFANQSEESLDGEPLLKVEQPIVDIVNRPVIDAALEETGALKSSEPLSSITADGSTF